MKKMLFISLVSIMCFSLHVSAKENQNMETKTETIDQTHVLKGFVFDKSTNESLAGAIITANGQKVYSDLDGNFEVTNLCGAKCQIKVSLISYIDETVEIDTNNLASIQIKLKQR
jgi:hypothetical protein